MKVLVVGSGGREHAVVRKLLESPRVDHVYCAPGNGGIGRDAENVPLGVMDVAGVVDFARQNGVGFVCVTPEDPLAAGMVDALQAAGIPAFGPNAAAAQIEASKVFSKGLMRKYGIPTAAYEVCSDPAQALSYIRSRGRFPVVVKADGLALGKGVLIAQNLAEAEAAVKTIMEDKAFGASGNQVVVEEFLTGPEVSVLAFTDGKCIRPMVSSMDHKRALDGNKGKNTGGMGTISPNPFYTDAVAQRCMQEIFLPTVHAMQAEGRPFCGCLYFGLMLTPDGPKVIEYNCRFGDPEAQVVLPRLDTDLLTVFEACANGTLDQVDIRWKPGACACVAMASGGYPEHYRKGLEIHGLDQDGQVQGATVYHAGSQYADHKFWTNGGRVLGVTCMGDTLDSALQKAYAAVARITWEGVQYRHDIGRAY